MRPLRVLHVTPYFVDAWAYGGIPRVATALARGLAARGHHVTVCATDVQSESTRLPRPDGAGPGSPGRRLQPWPPSCTEDGVELRVFPNISNRLAYEQLFTPLGLGDYLRRAAGSFDVAHLHACRNLPGTIAARHLRRAGVPYIVAPNGTAPRLERRQLAKRVFDTALGGRLLRDAARVLAVSEAEVGQLRALGVESNAIRFVPNPIDVDEFSRVPTSASFRARLATTAPLVLFLGRITPRKRLDVVIRAFAGLPRRDAVLVIAGNDAGAGRAARALARELGVADRTVFTGLLRGAERLDALAAADVVVYPSEDEIFGLVPLEALLSGTPVAVADGSGCAEVVRGVGGGAVVPVGSADALALAIDDALTRPAYWRRAAADAAKKIRARFASDVICALLDDVYQELVAA